ncbi:M23 family metallopeptidase [Paramicrobacterium agarici]|uniref:M23 family metallopeptidase n=1 Tax=Paramicrobacterium agarici TaxID=630514 RepID=UPI0011505EC0|nr:M23 family metallopeptidase [Microbacterium agarici]
MNAATAMGLNRRAQQIGVMTAMGESSLKNLDHGDAAGPDSLGLFQQRDNWGSRAERMDPTTAATLFYSKMVTVEGWETMEPTAVAHTVQVNADPDHYTKYWEPAQAVVAGLGSGSCGAAVYPLDQPYMQTSGYGPRTSSTPGASSWHPAVDLVGQCGDPVYAVLPGVVTKSEKLWLSVTHPDGFVISYLHTYKADRSVDVGDVVQAGQQIAKVGDVAPATGCHLDLRINVSASSNAQVNSLPQAQTIGGPAGYVDPTDFMALFGIELCPAEWCTRT